MLLIMFRILVRSAHDSLNLLINKISVKHCHYGMMNSKLFWILSHLPVRETVAIAERQWVRQCGLPCVYQAFLVRPKPQQTGASPHPSTTVTHQPSETARQHGHEAIGDEGMKHLKNETKERFKWLPTLWKMREITWCLMLKMCLASDTQSFQSSDWTKSRCALWHCLTSNILSDQMILQIGC